MSLRDGKFPIMNNAHPILMSQCHGIAIHFLASRYRDSFPFVTVSQFIFYCRGIKICIAFRTDGCQKIKLAEFAFSRVTVSQFGGIQVRPLGNSKLCKSEDFFNLEPFSCISEFPKWFNLRFLVSRYVNEPKKG